MAGIPGREPLLSRVLGKSAVYDFILAPLAVLSTLIASYDFLYNDRPIRGWLLFAGGVAVLLAGSAKACVTYWAQRRAESIHEIEGCLHTLHSILCGMRPAANPRLTIHRVVGDQEIEQITDYIGGTDHSRRRTAHRRFPIQSGIVGEACRSRQPIVAQRKGLDYETYVQELITVWHYTEADARRMSPGAMSWMAVPLVDDETRELRGVVFVDCTIPDFFDGEIESVVKTACVGIARFVKKRYY